MDCSFKSIDSSNLEQYLREACAKVRSLEEQNKLMPEVVFELDLSFNYLKVEDMSMVHKALLQCPKLVVYVGNNSFSWPELEKVMSKQHLRLWVDERISMAFTVNQEDTEDVIFYQAEESLPEAFSESHKQLGSKGMVGSFGLEDAVRAAVIKAYESEGYYVVPVALTVVYGRAGDAIYGFDFAYAAHRPGSGEDLLLLGDIKSSVLLTDVEVFLQKVGKLTMRFAAVAQKSMPAGDAINYAAQIDLANRLLRHKVVSFVAGWHMLPEAILKARDAGCRLVAPDGSDFTVYHGTDIDDDLCHRLAPPPVSLSDEV